MIEKMKTVSMVCLEKDRQTALESLRSLKLMHVRPVVFQGSKDLARAQKKLDYISRVINLLEAKKPSDEKPEKISAEEIIEQVRKLNRKIIKSQEEWDQLVRYEELLGPWGEFDAGLIEEIKAGGLYIYLCSSTTDKIPELPSSAALKKINKVNDNIYYIVVSDIPVEVELPEVILPVDMTLKSIKARKKVLTQTISESEQRLAVLAHTMDELKKLQEAAMDDEDLLSNLEGMGRDESLCTITGYVPVKSIKKLKDAAMTNGWALQITEPKDDDTDVPTLITIPKLLQISKPLFDFVGITPGYREFDISAWFLIFFSIFFAIIVGDGGYGSIFLIATLIAKKKAAPSAQVAVNLLLLLSSLTIIWGFLTGNFFGMDQTILPGFMRGIPYFSGENAQANTQFFCFLIGAIHLTIGHGIKLSAVINSTMAIAQLGWILIIWGYFFLGSSLVTGSTFPGFAKYLFIAGAIAIVLFSVPTKNILKAVGGGLGEFLGGIVNSFVDVLSYIRLFAVGLSSYYVAVSFNGMGSGIIGAGDGALAIPLMLAGAVVIIFGHTLNIALCGLSVLVHGIRLNTLEFSGHVGLEWVGIPFKAFRKRIS